MVSLISDRKPKPKIQPCESPCPPVCPDCGGLECLCRPRFFSGQLLTDEDLRRLDHYIVAKNRLHNRYLIGWGVVCGLEVVCNTCDSSQVTVKAGYALSKCGDDIVVCADVPVDVCTLIRKCRRQQPPDCGPFQTAGTDPCPDATETWILSIHYDEKPSRGVTPLKGGGAACCSRCACGGSSSCGCGCHDASQKSNGNGASQRAAAPALPQCEPTIVCEGYRFEVCKLDAKTGESTAQDTSAMGLRFLCCVQTLFQYLSQVPALDNANDIRNWCCAIRKTLLDFFASNPGYDCTVAQRLSALCPPAGQAIDVQQIVWDVVLILAEYMQKCLCSMLLPPCAGTETDARVPLATITITSDCKVLRICNLDVRKFVTTFPNLFYWFSGFPYLRNLRKLISGLCCTPLEFRKINFQRSAYAERARAVSIPVGGDSQEVSSVAAQAWTNRNKGRIVDAQAVTMSAVGLVDEQGNPFLTDLEQSHPLEALFFNQLFAPLLGAMIPKEYVRFPGGAAVGEAAAPPPPPTDLQTELSNLKTGVQNLQEQFKKYQARIDEIKKTLKTKPPKG